MYLAIVKLIEVLARAAFTVGLTFALPLAEAGRFGLAVTLIGLFAFAFNWERHIDIQRRLVRKDPAQFDAAVRAMMRLWLVNYGWMLPLFAATLFFWADLSWRLIAFAMLIAVCEQIANSAYNLAVVQPRYRPMVAVVAAKSLILLGVSAALILVMPDHLSFDRIMEYWAVISLAFTLPLALMWQRLGAVAPTATGNFFAQHRASMTHFLTGLLAVLILQVDRLLVGGLMDSELAGVFFRHVMIIGFAYQLFNIAAYNRRLPTILGLARDTGIGAAQRVVVREMAALLALVTGIFAMILWLDAQTSGMYTKRFAIIPSLLAVMLVTALLRMIADFQALILNACLEEHLVLRNQFFAFLGGAVLLIVMTFNWGYWGAAIASLISATLYVTLNLWSVGSLARPFGEDTLK